MIENFQPAIDCGTDFIQSKIVTFCFKRSLRWSAFVYVQCLLCVD